MSDFIFRKPMAKSLAITSWMTLGLSFYLGAAPVFHQPGQQFSAVEWQKMGSYSSREGDLIVLKNGSKIIGELAIIPSIQYTFGDISFALQDVALLSFITQPDTSKLQVITRDGLNFIGPITNAKITIKELLPNMNREPQYIERRIDPATINFIALSPRQRDSAQASPSRFYQLTLQNGDEVPITFDREEIHLSDGWQERVIQGNQIVEANFNGVLQGTIEDASGLKNIGCAFVKEPQLKLNIPHCEHSIEMPWEYVAHLIVDGGDYLAAKSDQSIAEQYYPEPKIRVSFIPEAARFDDMIPAYKESELTSYVVPELLKQGPRQVVAEAGPRRTDEMVLISGGQFYVAIDDDVASTTEHNLIPTTNKPSFVIEIAPFYIDKHEVTNAQYLAFVRATGHLAPKHWNHLTIPLGLENAPVVNVNYQDATAYAAWVGKRLPTEVEWQRASEEASMMVAVDMARTQETLGDQAFSILSLIAGFETVLAADESSTATLAYVMEDIGGRVAEWTSSAAVVDRQSPLAQVAGMYYTNAAKYMKHKVVRQGFISDNEAVEYRSTHHQSATSDKIGFRCVDEVPLVFDREEISLAKVEPVIRGNRIIEVNKQEPRQAVAVAGPTDEMVLVSGGQFYVAVDDDVASASQHNLSPTANKPSFAIEIAPFYVDKHEVTNAQYLAFVRATGYLAPKHWNHLTIPLGLENAPVVNVNYQDAAAYAAWAGKRLPTEVEWQRASEETSMMVAVDVARTQQTLGDQAFSILSLIAGFETALAADESSITTLEYVMEDIGSRVAEWTSSAAAIDRQSQLAQEVGRYYTNTEKYGKHKIVRQGVIADNGAVEYRSTQHQSAVSNRIGFRCVTDVL